MRLKDTFDYLQKHFKSSKEIGADTYIAYAKAINSAFKIHRNKLKKNVNHGCTSHLSAVDGDGNMVALTYTLLNRFCLLYTSPSPRDRQKSRMPSSA